MFVLVGFVIVFVSILLGYTMHGGKVAALMQYTEFIIIGGAAFGSVVIGSSFKGAIELIKAVLSLLKGNPYTRAAFLELLTAMYDVFSLARSEGILALENHAENPYDSELFEKYPALVGNHHAMDLFADTLKVVIMGGVNIYDLSEMIDIDLETRRRESMHIPTMLTNLADSMPGFGIVAAVLGVVITMQAVGGLPEQVGQKVAGALVGTFLGVLLAYGIFAPLARATEHIANCEMQFLSCIKNGVVAFARGDAPLICVEFARRNIEPELRPSFSEMEDACRKRKKEAAPEQMDQAA
ncbi:MAG: flagellar motor stator protein MotA [Armatimonadota bacterium]|nr:flagellar motor stator protein MotA [Armatimonadota bacterium]